MWQKPANIGGPQISTFYPCPALIFETKNFVHRRAFPLKIKFLEKVYNAYFSTKFQN
jgi:hypothetical protein